MDGSKPASMTSWSYRAVLGVHRGPEDRRIRVRAAADPRETVVLGGGPRLGDDTHHQDPAGEDLGLELPAPGPRAAALENFGRPFKDVEAMNRHLLGEWRRCMQPDDTILCLGDIAKLGAWGERCLVLELLACPGQRVLLLGNHDLNRERYPFSPTTSARPVPRQVGGSGHRPPTWAGNSQDEPVVNEPPTGELELTGKVPMEREQAILDPWGNRGRLAGSVCAEHAYTLREFATALHHAGLTRCGAAAALNRW